MKNNVDPPELVRNRKEMQEEMLDKFGYLFCGACQSSKAYKFECHHIVFRSEAPGHPMLHDKINLIIICSDCHTEKPDSFHRRKSKRNQLVIDRNLENIFGMSLIL